MNISSKEFDPFLDQIAHYRKFPAMKPYIGKQYGKNGGKKIMLVAESHYLPPYSTINKDANTWYSSSQSDLTEEELYWISTRGVVECDWKSDGHMIFRELDLRMSESMDTSNSRAMANVVFMNGFQRPAPETGNSIKDFCTELDYEVSARTLKEVIKILTPNLVLFVSKTAWDKLRWRLPREGNGRKYDYVCHPGTGGLYWHNKSYGHGVEKFRRLISELR